MKPFPFRTCSLLLGLASVATAQVDPSTAAPLSPAALNDAAMNEDAGDFEQLTAAVRKVTYRTYVINDVEYHTNATHSSSDEESSFVWFTTVGGTAIRRLAEPFSIEAAAAVQGGFYANVPEQDFWGVTGTVFLKYKPTSNISVYVGPEVYDYEAINTGDGNLVRGVAPTLGATYQRPLGDGRTVMFASTSYQHHYTDPSVSNRDVVAGNIGLVRKLSDTFLAQGYYEYRISNYTSSADDRQDQRNTIGLALLYTPIATFRMRTGFTFSGNQSNRAAAEYEALNIGLGSSLNWLF